MDAETRRTVKAQPGTAQTATAPPLSARDIRRLRPSKPVVDPWRPFGTHVEVERLADGRLAEVLTVFLSGKECPFTCVFCDLWRYTTDDPTPPGALPEQLRHALATQTNLRRGDVDERHIKLYNASNFFDPSAVPPSDDEALVDLLHGFDRVIVESHPKLIGQRCLEFAKQLDGAARQHGVARQNQASRLQVAMGLETVHPEAQPKLGKGADLDNYRQAAAKLRTASIGWRAFVLVGAPFVPLSEAPQWAARSVAFAFGNGAEQVALIPLRGGNGALEALAQQGDFEAPSLRDLELAFEACLHREASSPAGGRQKNRRPVVTVDTWDLDDLATCEACTVQRRERLERMNLSGESEPAVTCTECP